jgi:aminoglycoside phosphotransferase (APT) family kinase protein
VSTDHPETAASVTVIAIGYRARCTESGYRNLGRLILRYADAGGRPMSNAEFCYAHARVRLARDQAAGLKVYDDREAS